MPALTQDCWHVYYGDVHVGTIARRVGCSTSTNWNGAAVSIRGSRPMSTRDGLAAFRHVKPERFQSKSKVERIQRLLVGFRRTVARADHRTEIAMSNQNQNNPGVQNEGSKPDLDELTRKAQKEQEEKVKKGGTDEIKIVDGPGSIVDGMPGYG